MVRRMYALKMYIIAEVDRTKKESPSIITEEKNNRKIESGNKTKKST